MQCRNVIIKLFKESDVSPAHHLDEIMTLMKAYILLYISHKSTNIYNQGYKKFQTISQTMFIYEVKH